jgi:hypothetical protein
MIPTVKTWLVTAEVDGRIGRYTVLAPTRRLAVLNFRHEIGYGVILSVGVKRSA